MAGNSGKMTNEAIRVRGPRNVLGRRFADGKLFIYLEGDKSVHGVAHTIIARSYTMSYLRKLEKANG